MKRWLLILALTGQAWAYYPMEMWQAQRQASEGHWAEAARGYRQALKERPQSAEALYNLGVCLYRQAQFEGAEENFAKALELAPAGPLKGRAAYNLGNTRFQRKKLKEALEAYKIALRWNELDDDARYNIQVILDQMKQPPPKKNPPPQKDKNKDKNKNNDQNKNKNKNQKDKKKNKKDKDDESKQPPKDDKKNKDQKQPPGQQSPTPTPTPKPEGQPTPTPTPPQGQPSPSPRPQSSKEQREKEEAERLLQFFQNREKQAQKRRLPARPALPTGVDDW